MTLKRYKKRGGKKISPRTPSNRSQFYESLIMSLSSFFVSFKKNALVFPCREGSWMPWSIWWLFYVTFLALSSPVWDEGGGESTGIPMSSNATPWLDGEFSFPENTHILVGHLVMLQIWEYILENYLGLIRIRTSWSNKHFGVVRNDLCATLELWKWSELRKLPIKDLYGH